MLCKRQLRGGKLRFAVALEKGKKTIYRMKKKIYKERSRNKVKWKDKEQNGKTNKKRKNEGRKERKKRSRHVVRATAARRKVARRMRATAIRRKVAQ